jgi:hypothetical protein
MSNQVSDSTGKHHYYGILLLLVAYNDNNNNGGTTAITMIQGFGGQAALCHQACTLHTACNH